MAIAGNILMQRANVQLRVKESEVQRYLDSGYSRIKEDGTVIQSAVPQDLATLRTLYANATKEIEELKAENEKLKAELKASKAPKAKKSVSAE